jgi:hypothetical protein
MPMLSPSVSARRRRIVIGGAAAAASALLHLAAWSLLRSAPPTAPRGSAAGAMSVRWLQVSLLPMAAEPVQAASVHAAPERTAPRRAAAVPRVKRVARRAAHAVAPPPVVVPVAAPVDGAVFGLPRIGYGATTSGAMQAVAPAAVAWTAESTGAHDALRRQIAEHVQRQLFALPPAPADGRCTLADAGEPQLRCNSDQLTTALGDHAPSLARLVAAHQRSLPGMPVVLEAQAGRYRLLP